MSDPGKHAGAEARRVGAGFVAPDLEAAISRRRRARIVSAVVSSVLTLVIVIGGGAFLMRTDTDDLPVGTTTTTVPDQSTTTTRPAGTTTSAGLPAEPVYGGVVNVASDTDLLFGGTDVDGIYHPATINPLFDPFNASDVARLAVPGAYRIDPRSGEAEPWVLESIPRLSNGGVVIDPDGVTVAYHIKPRARWADGTPISFADFVFTHELIMREDLPIDEQLRELHSLVDSGTMVGIDTTVTFNLTNPDPRYERLFPWLVPAHAVDPETFGDDWNDKLWLSGGPFVFDGYEASSSPETQPGIIRLSRNNNYWEFDDAGNQLPYLDGIEMHVFSPGSVMVDTIASWFNTQSVDAMLGGVVSSYFVSSLGVPEEEGFVLSQSWDSLYEMLGFELRDSRFDVNPDSLNHELLYRQAVLSAIDRNALAADTEFPMTSIAGAASPELETDVWEQYDNPELASELLAELGAALDRDFIADPPAAVYTSSPGDEAIIIGEAIAERLNASGFEVTTEFTWDFFNINLPKGRNDMFSVRLFAGDGVAELAHLLSFLDPTQPADEVLFDWSPVGEPAQRFSDLMAEARATLDPDRLRELLIEAESILADNAIVYPLVRRQLFYVPYWPEQIQGIESHPGWDTATAARWWSPTG